MAENATVLIPTIHDINTIHPSRIIKTKQKTSKTFFLNVLQTSNKTRVSRRTKKMLFFPQVTWLQCFLTKHMLAVSSCESLSDLRYFTSSHVQLKVGQSLAGVSFMVLNVQHNLLEVAAFQSQLMLCQAV